MANGYQRVEPGDLITAARFNELLTALEGLESRVLILEGASVGSALTITRLEPLASFYRVGDPLTVIGSNFEFTLSQTRVFVGGTRVLSFGPGSRDDRLDFVIPPVPGVSESGTLLSLRVANSTEEATYPMVLRPPAPVLFGDVDIDYLSVDPADTPEGSQATFRFRITSRASGDGEFLIDPFITVATNQSIWQSRLRVLDESLTTISTRLILVEQAQQKIFHVRITQIPTGTDTTPFQLTVNATSGEVSGTSGAQSFEVGTAVVPPDTTITLNPQSATNGSLNGSTLTVAAGQTARIRFRATFETPGDYDLTLAMVPASGSGWTVARRTTTTPAQYTITAADINPALGVAERFPEFNVSPNASGASASAGADISYQRQGAPGKRTFPLNLSLGS